MRSAPKLVGATSIYCYLSWIAWKSLPSMDSHVSQVRTSMSLRCYDAGQKRYERKEHQTSDRHEPVVCVVAFVPTFMDRGTIVCALSSESVTTPSHVPNLK
jgi:hypothetical protein